MEERGNKKTIFKLVLFQVFFFFFLIIIIDEVLKNIGKTPSEERTLRNLCETRRIFEIACGDKSSRKFSHSNNCVRYFDSEKLKKKKKIFWTFDSCKSRERKKKIKIASLAYVADFKTGWPLLP